VLCQNKPNHANCLSWQKIGAYKSMEQHLNQITICEVCGNKELVCALKLGAHPMCDDLVPIGDSRLCKEYPIEILYCANCRTAHQRFQIPKLELFPPTYHYRSRFTADVLSGMSGLVDSCVSKFGSIAGKTVLDIGCNDGSLLDFFRQKGAKCIGIEPTDACADASQKGHVVFNRYLSEEVADMVVGLHGRPDFITFTNVFAHIENLSDMLGSLKKLMSPQTVLVIENHYLGSVLDGNQFDTFYHEHPRTYSYTSFVHLARSLGISLCEPEFPKRYGGNIRVFLGHPTITGSAESSENTELDEKESRFGTQLLDLGVKLEIWRETKISEIQELVNNFGKLRAKAFPGRAAIIVKLLGLTSDQILAVYEKPGSLKIGNYVPGTRIPILSDDDLFALPDSTHPVLNLAWHIPQEIRRYMKDNQYRGPIIDILSVSDFATRQ
jgi:hypothetical protein